MVATTLPKANATDVSLSHRTVKVLRLDVRGRAVFDLRQRATKGAIA